MAGVSSVFIKRLQKQVHVHKKQTLRKRITQYFFLIFKAYENSGMEMTAYDDIGEITISVLKDENRVNEEKPAVNGAVEESKNEAKNVDDKM